MEYDLNLIEKAANELERKGKYEDSIKLYLYMAAGDDSLDGGYIGKRLGELYEATNDLHAAVYWYGRAVDENPEVRVDCKEALERLRHVGIRDIVSSFEEK